MKQSMVVVLMLLAASGAEAASLFVEDFNDATDWQTRPEARDLVNVAWQSSDGSIQPGGYNSQGSMWYDVEFAEPMENIVVTIDSALHREFGNTRMEVNVKDSAGGELGTISRAGDGTAAWGTYVDEIIVAGVHKRISIRLVVQTPATDYLARIGNVEVAGDSKYANGYETVFFEDFEADPDWRTRPDANSVVNLAWHGDSGSIMPGGYNSQGSMWYLLRFDQPMKNIIVNGLAEMYTYSSSNPYVEINLNSDKRSNLGTVSWASDGSGTWQSNMLQLEDSASEYLGIDMRLVVKTPATDYWARLADLEVWAEPALQYYINLYLQEYDDDTWNDGPEITEDYFMDQRVDDGEGSIVSDGYGNQSYVWYQFNFPEQMHHIRVACDWTGLGGYFTNRMEVNIRDINDNVLGDIVRSGYDFTGWQVFHDVAVLAGAHSTIKIRVVVRNGTGVHCSRFNRLHIYGETVAPKNCAQAIDSGYGIVGDLNSDCYTNILDLAVIASDWAQCIDPQDPACGL